MALREHGEAIEADLDRFYGIDLLAFYRGEITARKLAVRVKGLPPDSAYYNLVNRPEQPEQDSGRHLQSVPCLEDIPVAGSLSEVGKFVNASDDEFSSQAG